VKLRPISTDGLARLALGDALLTEEALVAAVYLPYRGEIRDYAGDHQADKPALERLQAEWNRDGMMGFAALYPSYRNERAALVGWVERSETHRAR
jgi:hypothetical protein